ncbi:hypothetical protein DICSQDRAFT_170183 [Dichomitus squalens LYAD-421 SS1]|uniref:Uncharacterized protein n=1 Tax=Dichomitus squalens (strain LYAD-421) TaxID=732165 RepID=R7T0B7_DICSQ|nr:uncharacterized protein DICSQDRAFT_170183 [Dichomitus squalens LYAD-421 SS1]EJF61430.1 hypothetical protein DICSQDRAFT_170183 [Dichomitus squalens LYAD-421 SS1]
MLVLVLVYVPVRVGPGVLLAQELEQLGSSLPCGGSSLRLRGPMRVNEFAPSHSRLFKDLITVTKPNKPFQYTAKGTPRRHVSLDEYAEEIEELYKKLEESSQVDIPVPPSWSAETVRTYVRGVVKKVMKVPNIEDDEDLF